MTVTVRLFAILRERAGRDSVEIELPEGATVGDAFARLAATPGLAELVERMPVRMAVNREYAERATRDRGRRRAAADPADLRRRRAADPRRVTEEPLSADRLSAWVGDPAPARSSPSRG